MKGSHAIDAVARAFPRLDRDQIAKRLRYSTYVSVTHRILYFEIPKAACSALKDLILRIESCPDVPESAWFAISETRRDMGIHARDFMPVPSLVDLADDKQREVLESPSYFRMLVVRNPYARLVSAWRNKVLVCEPGFEYVWEACQGHTPSIDDKRLIPFEAFVRFVAQEDLEICNPHWRLQTSHAFLPAMNFNHVGQTENLPATLQALQRHLGSDVPLETRMRNVSGFQKDAAMTAELAETIYALYRDDFETFGYARESWRTGRAADTVSEQVFYDEIIERNIVIAKLYDEIERLNGGARRMSALSLAGLRDRFSRILTTREKP